MTWLTWVAGREQLKETQRRSCWPSSKGNKKEDVPPPITWHWISFQRQELCDHLHWLTQNHVLIQSSINNYFYESIVPEWAFPCTPELHEQEDYTFTSLTGRARMSLSKGQDREDLANRAETEQETQSAWQNACSGSGGWYYRTLLTAQKIPIIPQHSTRTMYPSQLGAVSWVCSLYFPIRFAGRLGKKTISLFWAHWNIVTTVCSIILSV